VWNDENLKKLARYITDLLNARERVENVVFKSVDNTELTGKLADIVRQFEPNSSEEVVLTISQCFMKDLSAGKDESENRERIYSQWVQSIKEGGAKL
jgi:hypothetical protein